MLTIPLTKGQHALIDDIDSDLSQFIWHCASRGYAVRREKKTRSYVSMHRVILSRKLGRTLAHNEVTDHINRNGVDNRRENLRVSTTAQNNRNRTLATNNKSGFTGVSWYARRGKWQSSIRAEGKTKHLGYFDDVTEAAKAYDRAAALYHGEYASLNFPA